MSISDSRNSFIETGAKLTKYLRLTESIPSCYELREAHKITSLTPFYTKREMASPRLPFPVNIMLNLSYSSNELYLSVKCI